MKNAIIAVVSLVLGLGLGWVNAFVLRKSVCRYLVPGRTGPWNGIMLAGCSLLRLAFIAAAFWFALKSTGVMAAIALLIGVACSTMLAAYFRSTRAICSKDANGRN